VEGTYGNVYGMARAGRHRARRVTATKLTRGPCSPPSLSHSPAPIGQLSATPWVGRTLPAAPCHFQSIAYTVTQISLGPGDLLAMDKGFFSAMAERNKPRA
jgi:hypothetical protein